MDETAFLGFGPLGYGRALLCAGLLHAAVALLVIALSARVERLQAFAPAALTARLAAEPSEPPKKDPSVKAAAVRKPASAADEKFRQATGRKVLQHWSGPTSGLSQGLSCDLLVTVLADGTVEEVEITRSSGSGEFDRSVVKAVRAASPLPPPPAAELRDGAYEFEMTFDPTR
ncbi:MAG TPA: cell envelope integrity protein TolA [Usitatibacter sp.]|nr:cell envelope integrity protein TolA [Usitatibacter sp.]